MNPIILLIIPLLYKQSNAMNQRGNINASVQKVSSLNTANIFSNMDLEERKEMIQNIMPYLSGRDKSTMLKLQDMLDIVFKLNRIKDNNYKLVDLQYLDNLPLLEKAQGVLKEVSKHLQGEEKYNTEKIMDLMNGVEIARVNLQSLKKNGTRDPNTVVQSMNPLITGKQNTMDKVKNMLNLLNEAD